MNRGSDLGLPEGVVESARFNEAPIHESGKSCICSASSAYPAGFNEAPIHESGKWKQSGSRSGRGRGFNEAPIHESGKCRVR